MKKQRKIYLVDRQVQLQIATRVGIYWCASLLFAILPLAFIKTCFGDGGLFTSNVAEVCKDYWPVFAMLALFLPFAIFDSIRISNRFAGPLYRLRTDLKRYQDGEKIGPIKFREGDCYADLPESINALVSKIDDLESIVATELQHDALV